jgi:enoyl-CoA hydratase
MEYTGYKHLLIERREKVLRVTLNRPEQRNAIDPALDREILRILTELHDDNETNVVVLTGAGKAFSAGGDIPGMKRDLRQLEIFEKGMNNGKRILAGILDCPKPIICRLNGDAIGLGATLALFCDIVIADEKARIADPHVKVGLVAGDGGAIIWPVLIGYARAKRYLFSGDMLDGKKAEEIGLVAMAVPTDQLDATVDEWANKLSGSAGKALKWTKTSVNIALKQALNLMVDAGFAYEAMSSFSEDHEEAVNAFLDKRSPKFTGR